MNNIYIIRWVNSPEKFVNPHYFAFIEAIIMGKEHLLGIHLVFNDMIVIEGTSICWRVFGKRRLQNLREGVGVGSVVTREQFKHSLTQTLEEKSSNLLFIIREFVAGVEKVYSTKSVEARGGSGLVTKGLFFRGPFRRRRRYRRDGIRIGSWSHQ